MRLQVGCKRLMDKCVSRVFQQLAMLLNIEAVEDLDLSCCQSPRGIKWSLALPYCFYGFFFSYFNRSRAAAPVGGRSPIEWGDFPSVRPYVRLSVRPSVRTSPLWLALRPCWLDLRHCRLVLRPLQLTLRPLQLSLRP